MGRFVIAAYTPNPSQPIRISAQQRLERFYAEYDFKTVSEPYDEDGIPHMEMLRGAAS